MEENNEYCARIISISGYISEESGLNTVQEICTTFCEPSITQIVLVIASYGGSVDAVSPILEVLKMSGKKIITIGMQHVASSAAAIFMAGSQRILFPNTDFLIHESSVREIDKITQSGLEKLSIRTKAKTKIIWDSIIQNSTITQHLLQEKCSDGRDWYLSEEEIKKYGIITEEYNMDTVRDLLS